jgi:hypothetical protein
MHIVAAVASAAEPLAASMAEAAVVASTVVAADTVVVVTGNRSAYCRPKARPASAGGLFVLRVAAAPTSISPK